MWVQAALIAGQMWLSELTRKRPHKVTFEEFQQSNKPSEIRPIIYVAGTKEIIPSRKWYGDFKQRAVERDSHWTDYIWAGAFAFLLDAITVGYRYYCAEMFELCYGPDTHIEQIKIRDRITHQATIGADNAGGGFLMDDPQAWGGDQPPGEGGEYAWIDVTRGNYSDHTNAYLEGLLNSPPNKTPSGRGVSWLIKRGSSGPAGFPESAYFAAGGIGYNPTFGEWKITVRRQPNNLGTLFSKIGRHANPAEVLWEWGVVSLDYGAHLPLSKVNIASFQAAAETFHEEGNGWSGKIETPTSAFEVCRNIAAQVDAVLDASPSLGWTIRLIRRDYSFGSLPILDKSVITRFDGYSPGAYEDTINKIVIPYEDINNRSADRPAIYTDPANLSIQGFEVPQTQEYIGVGDSTQAGMLATRDGRAFSLPRGPLECWVKPSWGKLRYRGEVVKWVWENPSFTKLMRLTAISPGNVDNSDYKIVSMEDQFATGARTQGTPTGTEHVDPSDVLAVAPPSASWDTATNPPDGLVLNIVVGNAGDLTTWINGRIIFGAYAPGGQFTRIWVTEPLGTQTLSPLRLPPELDNKAQFNWPVLKEGLYEFCIQTFSITGATNNVKVCAEIEVVFSESGANAVTINGVVVTQNGVVMTGGW